MQKTQTSLIPTLFGTAILNKTERQLAVDGIKKAEAGAVEKYNIEKMRRWARHYVHSNQSRRDIGKPNAGWADKVRMEFDNLWQAGRGNNFMGGLFCKPFVWTGEFVSSKTPDSHGNLVRLWTLPDYIHLYRGR